MESATKATLNYDSQKFAQIYNYHPHFGALSYDLGLRQYGVEDGMAKDPTRYHLIFKTQLNVISDMIKDDLDILDLGCGLNPLELASRDVHYYASDINQTHLDIIKEFFKKNHIKGQTFIYDLRNLSKSPEPLPETDLALLFKVLDIIDDKGRANAEKIINMIPAKHILASFSTIKISGKKMNRPERQWFEKMLARLGKKYSTFSSENEIFYLIDNEVQYINTR